MFVGIRQPEKFRQVTRAHVLAWRSELESKALSGPTIRASKAKKVKPQRWATPRRTNCWRRRPLTYSWLEHSNSSTTRAYDRRETQTAES